MPENCVTGQLFATPAGVDAHHKNSSVLTVSNNFSSRFRTCFPIASSALLQQLLL